MNICEDCICRKYCGDDDIKRCDRYFRDGGIKKEQTNEEWLRSCTTEELVKMILDLCDYRPCFACGIGYCDDENWCHVYSDEAKEFVVEWLKQPHTPQKQDDYPCNVKGCTLETRQSCCGCPDYFKWEKEKHKPFSRRQENGFE